VWAKQLSVLEWKVVWVFKAIFFNSVTSLCFWHRKYSLLNYFSIHVEMEWRNPCLFEPQEQQCCCPKQQPYFKQEMTQQVLHQAAAFYGSSSSVISWSVWKLFEHTTDIYPKLSSAIYFYTSVTYILLLVEKIIRLYKNCANIRCFDT
jgi:hypothetical protein